MAESGPSLWEALAGRSPGRPIGPADPNLFASVVERLNPARARPRLRSGIEEVTLTSVRGGPYVMLRSPTEPPAYLRLHPNEVALAHRMDGDRTVAALVAEFAKLTGRLAPEQVLRVVADLAGNRMLDELPVNAYHPLGRIRRRSPLRRIAEGMGHVLSGRRYAATGIDPFVTALYRWGAWVLFTRPALVLMSALAVVGGALFIGRWIDGSQSAFLVGDSNATGLVALLGLNVVCLIAHELGHALAAKHAGRRVPVAGVLLYFCIPSVFVETSDVWMADRRARLRTAAAGPAAAVLLAGTLNVGAAFVPGLGPIAFKLSFLWYLNALFNLNPMLPLDGYHLLMDWLELPNLRARGLGLAIGRLRRWRFGLRGLVGEDRLYALYGHVAIVWLVITLGLGVRIWKDRVDGLGASLWHEGVGGRIGFLVVAALLFAPLVGSAIGWLIGRAKRRIGLTPEIRMRLPLWPEGRLAFAPIGPHPEIAHPPPLVRAEGVPAASPGDEDARFERKLRRLLLLLLLLAVAAILIALPAGRPWAELPSDRVLAVVAEGSATIHRAGGTTLDLRRGDRIALAPGDRATVSEAGFVELGFRGGALGWLCASTDVGLIAAGTDAPASPVVQWALADGAAIIDASIRSAGYQPLTASVRAGPLVRNDGPARFLVASGGVLVASGTVLADDLPISPAPFDACPPVGPGGSPGAKSPPMATRVPSPTHATSPAAPTPTVATSSMAPSSSATPSATPISTPSAIPTAASTALPTPVLTPAPTPAPTSMPTPVSTPAPSPVSTPAPSPVPDFAIRCLPTTLAGSPGATLSSACTVSSIGGFSGSVALGCPVAPLLGTCAMSVGSVVLQPGSSASVTLTMVVASSAPPGCHTFRATASANGVVRSQPMRLDVPDGSGQSCG